MSAIGRAQESFPGCQIENGCGEGSGGESSAHVGGPRQAMTSCGS